DALEDLRLCGHTAPPADLRGERGGWDTAVQHGHGCRLIKECPLVPSRELPGRGRKAVAAEVGHPPGTDLGIAPSRLHVERDAELGAADVDVPVGAYEEFSITSVGHLEVCEGVGTVVSSKDRGRHLDNGCRVDGEVELADA